MNSSMIVSSIKRDFHFLIVKYHKKKKVYVDDLYPIIEMQIQPCTLFLPERMNVPRDEVLYIIEVQTVIIWHRWYTEELDTQYYCVITHFTILQSILRWNVDGEKEKEKEKERQIDRTKECEWFSYIFYNFSCYRISGCVQNYLKLVSISRVLSSCFPF